MKKWVIILIVLFIAAAAAVMIVALKAYFRSRILDGDGMENNVVVDYVYYESSGGMDGAYTCITARRNTETGAVKGTSEIRKSFRDTTVKQEYEVDEKLLDEIAKMVVESSFWYAADRPKSKDVVLDAPSRTLKIVLGSGEEIYVEDYLELSDKEWDAWREIVRLLEDESYKLQ